MAPHACSGFVPAPLYVRPMGFSSRPLRTSRQPCTKKSFSATPNRRLLFAPPSMCSGHGRGGGDTGFSFDTGPSADVGHSHSSDVGHSHSSEAGHATSEDRKQSQRREGAIDDAYKYTGDSGLSYVSAPDDGGSVVQGPSQAPTQEGVSTVGMSEEDAKFITACYDADVTAMEEALDNGQDVNVVDVNRRSALHFCAGNGLPTLCQRLLEENAEIDARDVLGFTPLHMATGYKKLDTVKLLVEWNADANIASLQGELAVEVAERMFENTPKKKFLMKNDDYIKLKEIVEVLDKATELEEDEEDEESSPEILEETASAKFVVRVRPKGEESTPSPPDPPASDVKVTIRVKEPKT